MAGVKVLIGRQQEQDPDALGLLEEAPSEVEVGNQISEHAFALLLALTRSIPTQLEFMRRKR